MALISEDQDVVTLINVFTVEHEGDQLRAVAHP